MIARRTLVATGVAASAAACSPADILNATVSGAGVSVTKDIAYAPGPRRKLDVYRPTMEGGALPLVVFIYGGSWRTGDKAVYPFVAEPLARRGAVVVVPDYRLYPEVAFPSFLEDNAKAVAWAFAHARALGAAPSRIVLLGHSAGAYNVAMLALDKRWLDGVGIDRSRLAGAIGLAGPYDFLPITDPDVIPVFAPVNDGPASQPITYVDGTNPPMLLAAGLEDTTVKPRNTRSLAARIREKGGTVETRFYKAVGHIGIITAFASLFRDRAPVLDDVWSFIEGLRACSPQQDVG